MASSISDEELATILLDYMDRYLWQEVFLFAYHPRWFPWNELRRDNEVLSHVTTAQWKRALLLYRTYRTLTGGPPQ